ncbi:Tvp15p [Cyberlindnera jadinii NRRL Y-1542]|uniref:COPI associated n=1 Tax=Cyberlindnera jadinii (strain ATCC 18201 / CBS 1600 / BCRC 20928 / JCM 3617 / NBRC 0987 / NRRL Y-1542) TaxID=983966 RepID=A0A1E4S955_CYBJN|nr:COPI associated [Cyberlindnera jadinii NRRL Y-1542]ODV76023.1 COPI associated [Cyberlindnera jadinii NRRL Y-1542]
MSDLSGVFKIVNLTVGGISAILGLTQLLSGVAAFFLGLYLIAFGVAIGGLEFIIPPLAYHYASFLFSFLGRGVFYVLIGVLIAQGGNAIRIVFGFLIVVIGIVYAVLEFIPSIEPPENFKAHGHVLEDNDEEDII